MVSYFSIFHFHSNSHTIPDPIVTPEAFAQSIVEDYTLPSPYHNIIVKSIQDQLSDFKAHSANYDGESGELLPSSPTDHNHNHNHNDIQDQSDPMRGILDDESIAWWMTWRKRNEIAVDTAARSSRHNKQQRKKRRIVVDPEEDGDSHMFGDNEQEDDGKDKEKEGKKKSPVRFMDEDFKPVGLNEIKIDEQAMHEDIRILIKVSFYSVVDFFRC